MPFALLLFFAAAMSGPHFSAYPTSTSAAKKLSPPKIVTAEERRFRTTLQQAISKGYGVVDGGTEHERVGPNFAGSTVLVQWGCGSNCMKAALINAQSGHVFQLPRVPGQQSTSQFALPTGSADLRTLKFRANSRLLGIPNVANGRTYYFLLEGHRWKPVGSFNNPEAFR